MTKSYFTFHPKIANQLLLNNRLPESEKATLEELKSYFSLHFSSEGYYLIASSGSAKKTDESVKLVALSIEALLNSAERVNKEFKINNSDIWGQVLPSFHVAGLGVQVRSHLSGSRVVESNWEKNTFFDWVSEARITLTSLVPAQIFDLYDLRVNCPKSLRAVFVGAGVLEKKIKEDMCTRGWPLIECYGMTETSSMIAVRRPGEKYYKLLDGVSVRVDQRSCLAVRCNSLMSASVQKVENEIILRPFEESFLQTDDMVKVLDEDGVSCLIDFVGRAGDYVKINGEGVSLTELKTRLDGLVISRGLKPQMFELIEQPEPRSGYQIFLIYEKAAGPVVLELVEEFNSTCRPYEKIYHTLAVEHFPRTELAKLKKNELQAMISEILQGGNNGETE